MPETSSHNALGASNNVAPALETAMVLPEEKHECTLGTLMSPLRRKAKIANLRLKAAESMAASSVEPAALVSKTSSALRYFGVPNHRLAVRKAASSTRGK